MTITPPPGAALAALATSSYDLIKAQQHPAGAYPASPTFSAYRGYAWLRDGSFTAEAMSRCGDTASAGAFHDWVARVLVARTAQVDALIARQRAGDSPAPGDMLPTRFTLGGADGSDPWWDFQLDGYGTWLWTVVTHAARHGADLARWGEAIAVAARYCATFATMPCYDWWEEHVEQRHVSTLGALWAGLGAATSTGILPADIQVAADAAASQVRHLALGEGTAPGVPAPGASAGTGSGPHLTKWLGTTAVDASLLACVVPFGLAPVGSALATGTIEAVTRDLDAGGGVHRFSADVFYGGGQWPLLSCLLGWNRAAAGDRDAALGYLAWAGAQATPAGDLPEQVAHHLLHPEHRPEWVEKWGPAATPLLWSHAMFLILADELGLR